MIRYNDPKVFKAAAIADLRNQAKVRQVAAVSRIIFEAVGGGGQSGVVRLTPKETGRARTSWQVLTGRRKAKLIPAGLYAGDVESISGSLAARAKKLRGARRMRAVFTVPYSPWIEHGSTAQRVPVAAPVRKTHDVLSARIKGLLDDL